jgi:hypothetical protein
MIRLPHPEVAALVEAIRRSVIRREARVVAGVSVSYDVFRTEAETPDLAFYDETGTIYIPEALVDFNEQYAHLIAFHEHVEVHHKRAGRAHAYAHRRAWLAELLAAKQLFSEADQLEGYLRWRIGLYPAWKNLNQAALVTQLMQLLAEQRPRRMVLFQLIKEQSL